MSKNANEYFLYVMAIGDACGMKYEFVEHEIPVGRNALCYGGNSKYAEYRSSRYTDDTQKSSANVELLLKSDPHAITKDDFVAAWLEAFKRDPREGYSKYMYQTLTEVETPQEFYGRIDPSKSMASGAAMSAACFGLLEDMALAKELTCRQAVITHNTDVGKTGALAVALATHFLHHGGKPEYMSRFIARQLGEGWNGAENGLTDIPDNGLRIVNQVFSALSGQSRLSDVLMAGMSQAQNADTDTICALGMAIGSRQRGMVNDLPRNLLDELENGTYGKDYLKHIDRQLLRKFPATDMYATFTP